MTSPLTWDEVAAVAGRGLGERVTGGLPLTPAPPGPPAHHP